MKALVGAFNQEKALVGAFSVIVKTGCGTDGALHSTILGSGPSREVTSHGKYNASAANQLIGEVVQSRRRPLLGPSPG